MAENNNIPNRNFSDEELLEYLRDNSSVEQANEIEKAMLEDSFLNDAMEGLHNYNSVSKIGKDVYDINTKLRYQTSERRKRRELKLTHQWILYITFIIIIAILIAFIFMQ